MELKYLIVFVSFCLLSACVEVRDNSKESEATATAQSSADFSYDIVGTSKANKYEILVKWSTSYGKIRIRENAKLLASFDSKQTDHYSSYRTSGEEVYLIAEYFADDNKIIASVPIYLKIPIDYVFEGEINLKDNLHVNASRVFVRANAVVTSQDKDVLVSTEEFISEGGMFRNFAPGSSAYFERDGRSGGRITIEAKSAKGALKVFLNGEKGGSGRNGATAAGSHPGCAGTSGARGGKTGSLYLNIIDPKDFDANYELLPGAGGNAGIRGGHAGDGPPDQVVNTPCDRDIPNGYPGISGELGQVCFKNRDGQGYDCK